jgi:DNA polymerase
MSFVGSDYNGIVFVLEAPGKQEVLCGTPVVGKAGKKLWDIAAKYQLYRDNFAIINTVNCRPIDGTKNGKPTIMVNLL